MLRFLLVFTLLGVGFFLLYQNIRYPHLRQVALTDRILAPFDQRVRYRIGEVDPRFGLTQAEVQELAMQATQIWQHANHKEYFVYDPKATLSINLIYDQRQSETNSRQEKLSEIETKQQLWQQRHQQMSVFKQQMTDLHQQLKAKRDAFNLAAQQYNQQIYSVNAAGHVSAEQRFLIEDQKLNLNRQKQQLEDETTIHNQKIALLNSQVNELNDLNQQLSAEISSFNTRFAGRQFDKGIFDGKQITIYEFISKDDLRLTIAHELGHALGLAHHNDPYGLMYPLMQKQDPKNFELSPADLALLAK